MKQISLLGCGWLGFPLAEKLITNGYRVNGSTTTQQKIQVLQNADINPFLITLNESESDISEFLQGSEILIIDIPPKLRRDGNENYIKKISSILKSVESSEIKYVLFISSTAVYADDSEIITEFTIPNPQTESGKQILAVEKMLFENSHFQTTTLRFGGLIGADRHPGRYLSGRELSEPNAPINLIQREDCIGIIEAIIEQNSWNETYNAAYPDHPTRKDYYTKKASEFNIEHPIIVGYSSVGKEISSQKISDKLRYTFTTPI